MAAGEYWTSADIVDCIVSYTVTQLMDIMTDVNSRDGAEMLAKVCTHNHHSFTLQAPQLIALHEPFGVLQLEQTQ